MLFDDEFVVYCERTERMHCLDRPASVVWALCDGTRTVEGVVGEVAELAGSEPDAVRSDVVATVDRFRELGILR
ncbi:MAG: PqqD family protein [Acidimicrobiales bacterium]